MNKYLNIKGSQNSGSRIEHFLRRMSLNPKLALKASSEYFELVEKLFENNGTRTTVKILKEINVRSRHYVSGYPKGDNDFGIWLRTNKDSKLPCCLSNLQRLLDSEPNVGLCIPNFIYTIRLEPELDLSTVTEPSHYDHSVVLKSGFKNWLARNSTKLEPSEVKCNLTTKGGPIGPAFCHQAHDMIGVALMTTPYGSYEDLIAKFFGKENWMYKSYTNLLKSYLSSEDSLIEFNGITPILAKLVAISGPAGKSRIIYVLNWWIQCTLLPLHDSMMNHFRIIGNDATWDQAKAVRSIRKWSAEGKKLYSFDLSAATDRWPVAHQELVIESHFGEEWSKLWRFLISRVPPYVKSEGKHVPYEIGQPMGAYSSWAALNLSHHMVLRYLCDEIGIKWSNYFVLGDDVVIANSQLAKLYQHYMEEILFVKINKTKSIICEDGKPSSAEFARHIIRDGRNVGTVSPNLLQEIFGEYQWWKQIEILFEFKDKFDLEIVVSPKSILIPARVDSFLCEKDKLLLILGIPSQHTTLPRRYTLESEQNLEGFVSYPNPYEGLDEKDYLPYVAQKLRKRAIDRLNGLNDLHTKFTDSSNIAFGYMLECEHHPIRMMLQNLSNDLMLAFWKIESTVNITEEFTITTQATDLLIDVFCNKKTFRDWKNSKGKKQKKMCEFYTQTYSEVLSLIEWNKTKPVENLSWENYAAAWE